MPLQFLLCADVCHRFPHLQSKLRRDDLSNTFARDRVYATIAATYERLFASALSEPAVLVHALDTYVHSPPRSVDQLRAAGYSIALSKKDPFASDHHDAVINAIARQAALTLWFPLPRSHLTWYVLFPLVQGP